MAIPVKQSTAQSFGIFMADSADGKTGKTGLTLTVTLKKYGETSFSSISPTQREIGSGHYEIDLTTTHMNTVGLASIRATASGADPADCPNCIDVVAYDKTSATRGTAGTALPAVAAEAAGGLYTRGTGAGQINQDANGRADVNAVAWNELATVALPLAPTTAGRTLDVSAGGEAGIDWANVGSPTTTVDLTGTTVGTLTALATDAISAAAVSSAAVTKIVAGVVAYSYRSGRTVLGLLRRLSSSLEVVTGLNGTTATFKQPDGTTTEFTVTQDITNGARTAVNVTNSETP